MNDEIDKKINKQLEKKIEEKNAVINMLNDNLKAAYKTIEDMQKKIDVLTQHAKI